MHSGEERCLLINISVTEWFSLGVAAVTPYILSAEINVCQNRHTCITIYTSAIRKA